MFQFPGFPYYGYLIYHSMTLSRRVSPFGNLWLPGYLLLPTAFRSLSRPSSAPSAKAFPLCSYFLELIRIFLPENYFVAVISLITSFWESTLYVFLFQFSKIWSYFIFIKFFTLTYYFLSLLLRSLFQGLRWSFYESSVDFHQPRDNRKYFHISSLSI